MKSIFRAFLTIGTLALCVSASWATTITIGASKDTTIFQNNVNNSAGAGNGLFAGTNGASSPRRGLIAFDIADNIPSGAIIDSVQLTLVLGQVAGSGGGTGGGGTSSSTIDLHRLTADWGEGVAEKQSPPTDSIGGQGQGAPANDGDATWNARFYSAVTPTLWATPGGDFASQVSASATVGTTLNVGSTWGSTAALVSDVQGWLNSPTSNFGWALVNENEVGLQTFRAFYSRDVATAAFHPQLQVTFETVPEPAGIVLSMMAAPLALALRRRGRHGSFAA
ncbi:MAG TPA: DNRLRE domain-containing protein [Pirellulales bacterium]|jgi:hypothetical protein|nr:DNRLRE domain-containing protein [Pirellulales bacterium]